MLVGFSVMVFLTIMAGLYAIVSLKTLSSLSKRVVQEDLPLIEASSNLMENLLAQDLYAKRFLILRDSKVKTLFWERSEEFNTRLMGLHLTSSAHQDLKERVAELHRKYDELFRQQEQLLTSSPHLKAGDSIRRIAQ